MPHLVEEAVLVADVNIWIDACLAHDEGVGPPVPWWIKPTGRLTASAALFAGLASPLTAETSIFVDELLEDILMRKLTQPPVGDRPEDRGMGWSLDKAKDAFTAVLDPVHQAGRSRWVKPSAPPEFMQGADPEDCRIWGLFMSARSTNPLADSFLVSRDRDFVKNANDSARRLYSGRPEWMACPPWAMTKILGFWRA